MATLFEAVCLSLFLLLVTVPALYGLHMYVLLYLVHRRRNQVRQQQRATIDSYRKDRADGDWPRITTQLPIYNELTVAARVIHAVARMDYPRGRHQIQVLDDSNDDTREIIDECVEKLQTQGHDVLVVRRGSRENYKAGALEHGLQSATGQFLPVFDADFIPDRGFLRRMVPLIATDDRVACVQGRWGHLNRDESWITKGLSLVLDQHFGIEQPARAWNGFHMNFNGTAGIWRRAAIEDERVGGWQGDTITEDRDLSYRAQLAGWKIAYNVDEVVPAEIPADVDALKTQQRRWATGSIQTARKLIPRIWRDPGMSLIQRLEASLDLCQYGVAFLMIALALFGRLLPMALPAERYGPILACVSAMLLIATIAPILSYIYARRILDDCWPTPLSILRLIVLGLGLSVNNGLAALVGLVQRGGEFVRTPKSGSGGAQRATGHYAAIRSRLWLIELSLAAVCFAQWLYFIRLDGPFGSLFLLLYSIGFFLMGWGSRPKSLTPPSPKPAISRRRRVRESEAAMEPALSYR